MIYHGLYTFCSLAIFSIYIHIERSGVYIFFGHIEFLLGFILFYFILY